MVVADFPIDTANVAKKRENIWNMYTYSKWKWPERTEEEEGEAIASFNKELQENDSQDEVEWIREAAEKCLLVVEESSYPKRPKTKERKHYTSDDWILSKSMVAIRHMRIQALSLADGDQLTQQVINRTKRRILKTVEKGAELISTDQYEAVWRAAKKGELSDLVTLCTDIIQTLDTHLSKKMRYERAKQMSINLKRRVEKGGKV